MENWIGVLVWIVMGGAIGLLMKALVSRPEERPGHGVLIAVIGSFAAVVGGMLGVGIFEFFDPRALSMGGMVGGAALATLFTFIYRWGIRGLT